MLVLEETTYDREWVFGTHLCLLLNFTVNQNYLETRCIQWNSENCIRDLVYYETKDIDICQTNENHRDLLSSQEDDVQEIVDEVYAIERLWLQAGESFGESEENEGNVQMVRMLQFFKNRGGCP